ncbi:hypothetical protein, partial [Escherichia coli]|uniref:hypothetical protein n=1 Tax=Escherichia coli TaxID=562 RepID=UPI0019D6516F
VIHLGRASGLFYGSRLITRAVRHSGNSVQLAFLNDKPSTDAPRGRTKNAIQPGHSGTFGKIVHQKFLLIVFFR